MKKSNPDQASFPAAFLPVMLFLCAASVQARTLVAATVAELTSKTAGLVAGDTLLVKAGTYDIPSWKIAGLKGDADHWITFKADGNAILRSTSSCCNLVEMSNLRNVIFEGFELTMGEPNEAIDGIKVSGNYSQGIRFRKLHIHHMTANGISLFGDSASDVSLEDTEIHHNVGTGLYWGYPGRSILHDILIQHNYIHDCPADPTQETDYGIQFKGWGHRAIIRDNVLHDVGGTTRSGLIVYYGKKPLEGDDPADANLVTGNVLWNCRNEGITAMSDVTIENNIVFDADVGINLQVYGDESFTGKSFVENLKVRNNSVFRCRSAGIAVSGWTEIGKNVSFTGNASYQPAGSGVAMRGSIGTAIHGGNRFMGTSSLTDIVGTLFKLEDFQAVAASDLPPALDFAPSAGSPLLNGVPLSATVTCPEKDFFGTSRPQGGGCDAGAVERIDKTGLWVIQKSFKKIEGGPLSLPPGKPGKAIIKRRGSVGKVLMPGDKMRIATPLFVGSDRLQRLDGKRQIPGPYPP